MFSTMLLSHFVARRCDPPDFAGLPGYLPHASPWVLPGAFKRPILYTVQYCGLAATPLTCGGQRPCKHRRLISQGCKREGSLSEGSLGVRDPKVGVWVRLMLIDVNGMRFGSSVGLSPGLAAPRSVARASGAVKKRQLRGRSASELDVYPSRKETWDSDALSEALRGLKMVYGFFTCCLQPLSLLTFHSLRFLMLSSVYRPRPQ